MTATTGTQAADTITATEPAGSSPPAEPAKVKHRPFTMIQDDHMDLIRRNFPQLSSVIRDVFYTLCREAKYRRKDTFDMSNAVLADRCHACINTISKAKDALASLKLITFESAYDKALKKYETTTYHLPFLKRGISSHDIGVCHPMREGYSTAEACSHASTLRLHPLSTGECKSTKTDVPPIAGDATRPDAAASDTSKCNAGTTQRGNDQPSFLTSSKRRRQS